MRKWKTVMRRKKRRNGERETSEMSSYSKRKELTGLRKEKQRATSQEIAMIAMTEAKKKRSHKDGGSDGETSLHDQTLVPE